MGANLPSLAGTPEQTLCAALNSLASTGRILRVSSLYRTEPVGLIEQSPFLNAVVEIEIQNSCTPHILLDELLRNEREFGRERSKELSMGPRTLDLDLLFFGDFVLSTTILTLPHPRLHERAFVLVPLSEIATDFLHPGNGRNISQLLSTLKFENNMVVRFESKLWTLSTPHSQ